MSRSQQVKRQPITNRNYVFTWGKYKGFSIAEIIADDPQYLEWLHHKTDFELGHILLDEVQISYEQAARDARLPSRFDR